MTARSRRALAAALLATLLLPAAHAQTPGDGGEDATATVAIPEARPAGPGNGTVDLPERDFGEGESVNATTVARNATVDRGDVFSALAIAANTGERVGFGDLATVERVRAHTVFDDADEDMVLGPGGTIAGVEVDAEVDAEPEDVEAALLLGLVAEGPFTTDDVLGAVNDGQTLRQEVAVERRAVDVPRSDALLAIALHNSAGGDLSVADVADVAVDRAGTLDAVGDPEISEETAVLALTLGIAVDGGGAEAAPPG